MHAYQWPSDIIGTFKREKNRVNLEYPTFFTFNLAILQHLFEQKVPSDWKRSLIVKIPKKGNLTICDNYRGISLLSVPSKIFCRILIDRIKMGVDEKLRQEQSGFRQGRGTLEQMFTLRNILEQCMEWQAPIYVNFVDFRKAFDSVIREKLWVIMKEYGIPSLYINIIRDLCDQSSSCI